MKQEETELVKNLLIALQPPSGGGNVYIDKKKVLGGRGTIKYPIESGAHEATFDMTGNPGEHYRVILSIEGSAPFWDVNATLDQSGNAEGTKNFQV